MSFINSGKSKCCTGETGSLHLHVVPNPAETEPNNLLCSRLSSRYLPHMESVESKLHVAGVHHGHASKVLAKPSAGLFDAMRDNNLSLRAMYCPMNASEHAIVAQLTSNNVQQLVQTGHVSVSAPLNQGTFHLHSAKKNYVTGIEFDANS